MLKKLLLRQWVLLLFAALSLQTASTQTFMTETFSSDAAFSTWTSANGGAGTQQWVRSTVPGVNFGFTPTPIKPFKSTTAANGFAFFNSDANAANAHVATLTSAPINCASQTSVRVRFHSQYAAFSGVNDVLAEVRVSSDGGVTWTGYQVLKNLFGFPTDAGAFVPDDVVTDIALPTASGKPSVLLQFRWTGNFEYGWKIDDIELYNFVAPKVDVTFKVNLSSVTPSAEGARLAGSFNGWSDDLMTNEGNGVWSITKSLSAGDTIQYKFKNGSGGWEGGQAACGVNDNNGGFNRQFVVKGDITLPTVCLNACSDCVVPCSANPANSIICDNIDTYVTTKKLGPQATHWTTWSGTEGTAEDGIVTTEQKASAPNSVKVLSTVAPGGTGGPQDVILQLGNKSTGRYSLKWKMYVPANKKGYYNIQEALPIPNPLPPANYNLDVLFGANGKGHATILGTDTFFFAYPHAQWFTIEHIVDLDNNSMTYLVNGKQITKIPYADKLGGIDFFGIDNTHLFYIDDVEYVTLPAYVANADICDKAVDLSAYFGQGAGVTQTTPNYDNTNATASPYDPAMECWAEDLNGTDNDIVDNSMWYTFVGDGKTYRIETSNTAGDGDTQMAIFEGQDCLNLTLSVCNDDISSSPPTNFLSGIDIETVAGQTYFIMVDGYNFAGDVWKGQFTLKITRKASILCPQGQVGEFTLDNTGFVCPGVNLADILTVDGTTFVIPNEGPNYGMLWLLSADPLDQSVWPDTNLLVAYTSLNNNVVEIGLPNNGTTSFPSAIYFLTPLVAGGVEKINPASGLFFNNLNADNGCFYVGESQPFVFLREEDLTEISAQAVVTNETVPPGNNGKINLEPTGGFPELAQDSSLYIFVWSNGATTEDLTGLAAGTYTVTVTDISNCLAPFTKTFVVGKTTGTEDPASVKSLSISPNPTTGVAQLNLTLANAAEVRIEVTNTLGQVLQTLHLGTVNTLSKTLDFSSMSAGTYMLRVAVDGETAVRRIVVQK